MSFFKQATFLTSAAKLSQLPDDDGIEVAFAGRSNAGKSSAINALCEQKSLAKTSKTPGRTQLINLFMLDESRRLVDLPGYGYAKVAKSIKERWQKTLAAFLEKRKILHGIVVVVDIRHLLKDLDTNMILWANESELPCHILLTKSDKLSFNARKKQVFALEKILKEMGAKNTSVQAFSAKSREGMDILVKVLSSWYRL